jgi:hypothetical protein
MSGRATEDFPGGWLGRHRFALAFVLVVSATLFVVPLLRQEVFTLRDHFDYFQPLRWFTAEELRAGRLPLWNPYNASGEPWLANPQTGVFYPPAWLFVILPFATAYMLFLWFHLVILGWGAYFLFARRSSRGAALVGAVALMFSGPMLSTLDISNNLATLAWVPFALWCAAEGAWRRGGVVLALAFLGGEPFFAAVAALMYSVTAIVASPRSSEEGELAGRTTEDRLRGLALAGALAFGLAAVQMFPFVESLRGSDRARGLDAAEVLRDSMPLRDWLRVVVPPAVSARALDRTLGQSYIPVVYVGIVTALLAVIGMTVRRRRVEVAGWLLLLGATVATAVGPALLVHLPMTPFRYPARVVLLAAFAIAALAAIGWDRMRVEKRWIDLVVVLVIAADLLLRAGPLLDTAPFRPHPVPFAAEVGAETKILRAGSVEPGQRAAWIAGYLNLYDRRYDSQSATPVASARYAALQRRLLEAPDLDLIGSFGIGWILSRHDIAAPFEPVARSGTVYAFRLPDPTPMATHGSRVSPAATPVAWSLGTSKARLTVDAAERGVVVLRQRSAPGWSVTVDGVGSTEIVIDEVFRGVEVAEGHHEIVWTYRPFSFLAGAVLTLFTLIALQISFFVKGSSHSSWGEKFSSWRTNLE